MHKSKCFQKFHKEVSRLRLDSTIKESLFNQFVPNRILLLQAETKQFLFSPYGKLLCQVDVGKKLKPKKTKF